MLSSNKVVPFYIPTSIVREWQFPHTLTNTGCYEAIKFVISQKEYLVFICISQFLSDVGHLSNFLYLFLFLLLIECW